jgi:hypothetical protein
MAYSDLFLLVGAILTGKSAIAKAEPLPGRRDQPQREFSAGTRARIACRDGDLAHKPEGEPLVGKALVGKASVDKASLLLLFWGL